MNTTSLMLRRISAPDPFDAYLIPVSGFPVLEPELSPLLDFLKRLTALFVFQREFSFQTCLQTLQLNVGGAAARVSASGREWIPMIGLGIFPDRESPKLWTEKDFEDLKEGELPRPLMHQVLRVTTSNEARRSCFEQMAGLGTAVHLAVAGPEAQFFERTKELLHTPLVEEVFRSFPFYVPLLDAASLKDKTSDQLHSWLCGAGLYIRESVEDGGILMVTSEQMGPVFEKLEAAYPFSVVVSKTL